MRNLVLTLGLFLALPVLAEKIPDPKHLEDELAKRGLSRRSKDATNKLMIENFIRSEVDGNGNVLMAEDVEAFSKLAPFDGYCSKDVAWIDKILKTAAPRLADSIAALKELAKEKLDFDSKETIPVSRTWPAYPKNRKEMKDRWRALVIDNVIGRLPDGPSAELISEEVQKTVRGYANHLEDRSQRLAKLTSDAKLLSGVRARVGCGDEYGQIFSPREIDARENPVANSCGLHLVETADGLPVVNGLSPGSALDKNQAIAVGETVSKLTVRVTRRTGSEDVRFDFSNPKTRRSHLDQYRMLSELAAVERCDVDVARKGGVETVRVTSGKNLLSNETIKFRDVVSNGKRIRIVSIPSFRAGNLARIKAALKAPGGYDAVALDLKNNGGGSVAEANALAALFLEGGKPHFGNDLTQRAGGDLQVRPDVLMQDETFPKVPLFVLANAKSASASEMVIGILQAQKRAVVIGDRTFGKATQMHVYVDNGKVGGLQTTSGVRSTPDGKAYQGQGLVPDIEIPDHSGLRPDQRETFRPEVDEPARRRARIEFEKKDQLRFQDPELVTATQKVVNSALDQVKIGDLSYREASERLKKVFKSDEVSLNLAVRQKNWKTIEEYYVPDVSPERYRANGFDETTLHSQLAMAAMSAYLKISDAKKK